MNPYEPYVLTFTDGQHRTMIAEDQHRALCYKILEELLKCQSDTRHRSRIGTSSTPKPSARRKELN